MLFDFWNILHFEREQNIRLQIYEKHSVRMVYFECSFANIHIININ